MELLEIQEYAAEEMEKVLTRLPKKKEGDIRFVFWTDLHYKFIREMRTTVSNVVSVLNELNKKEKIDFVCLGGDNVGNYPNSREEHIAMMQELAEALHQLDMPVLMLQGNHDDNRIHGEDAIVEDAIQYDVLFSHCEQYAQYHAGKEKAMYGYYDLPKVQTRVVLLNSSDVPPSLRKEEYWCGYTKEQLEWLCTTALQDAPEHVFFFQHIMFDHSRFPDELPGIANAGAVNAIIKAFANGEKICLTAQEDPSYTICHDFIGEKHHVAAKIAGHCHVDSATTDTDGFACVTTMLAGRKASGVGAGDDGIVYEREAYCAMETSMDIFTYCPKEHSLSAVRYGSGIDRVIC